MSNPEVPDVLSTILNPIEASPLYFPTREVTLDEIFDMDPTLHTSAQRDSIIAAMIDARGQWFAEETIARASGKNPRPSKGIASPKKLKGITEEEYRALTINLD